MFPTTFVTFFPCGFPAWSFPCSIHTGTNKKRSSYTDLCLYFYCQTKFDYGFLGYTYTDTDTDKHQLWTLVKEVEICGFRCPSHGITSQNAYKMNLLARNDELVNIIKRSQWYHLISLVFNTCCARIHFGYQWNKSNFTAFCDWAISIQRYWFELHDIACNQNDINTNTIAKLMPVHVQKAPKSKFWHINFTSKSMNGLNVNAYIKNKKKHISFFYQQVIFSYYVCCCQISAVIASNVIQACNKLYLKISHSVVYTCCKYSSTSHSIINIVVIISVLAFDFSNGTTTSVMNFFSFDTVLVPTLPYFSYPQLNFFFHSSPVNQIENIHFLRAKSK